MAKKAKTPKAQDTSAEVPLPVVQKSDASTPNQPSPLNAASDSTLSENVRKLVSRIKNLSASERIELATAIGRKRQLAHLIIERSLWGTILEQNASMFKVTSQSLHAMYKLAHDLESELAPAPKKPKNSKEEQAQARRQRNSLKKALIVELIDIKEYSYAAAGIQLELHGFERMEGKAVQKVYKREKTRLASEEATDGLKSKIDRVYLRSMIDSLATGKAFSERLRAFKPNPTF